MFYGDGCPHCAAEEKFLNEYLKKDKSVKLHKYEIWFDTENAKKYFIDNGYDEAFGARPLKRLVNRELETILAKKIINNEIKYGNIIL